MGGPKATGGTCKVCSMPERELVELDLLLATPPEELDAKLFGDVGMEPPDLPAEWRRFGVIRKAQVWLEERGHTFARQTLVAHYNKHLAATASIPSDSHRALQEGRLSDGSPVPSVPEPLKMAIEYHAYFRTGMQVGHKALELLLEKLNDTEHKPSQSLLIAAANIGTGLAKAQAAIVTKGMRFVLEDDGAIEGFIGDEDDDASPRFGSYRVRTIEGERRPVRDEGPADRAQYNEKAKEIGAPLLPSPEA